MSEKSSSSGSDEDVDPESGQPVELGGILSKVIVVEPVSVLVFCVADITSNLGFLITQSCRVELINAYTSHIRQRIWGLCSAANHLSCTPCVFTVDELHTWMAGPMGRVEKQYFELLQVGG